MHLLKRWIKFASHAVELVSILAVLVTQGVVLRDCCNAGLTRDGFDSSWAVPFLLDPFAAVDLLVARDATVAALACEGGGAAGRGLGANIARLAFAPVLAATTLSTFTTARLAFGLALAPWRSRRP